MHPLRVLIVDDEPSLAENIAALLRLDGHDVMSVTTGRAAVELIAGQAVDLLISDLMMPGMTGLELLRQLSARRVAPFWFVLMTGTPRFALPHLCGDIARLLEKPVSADQLRTVARECLQALREVQDLPARGRR